MYQYPFGDGQRLNLNWIINEIIQLRKQLDPDYTEPSFSQIYPFSDTQQLNLDWILSELKALKELAPEPTPTPEIDLDEVGKALLAAEYDATKSYQKNDYITRDGEILRATAATTGTYDSTKWQAVKLGDDLAIITRWASAMDAYINSLKASQIVNDSTVDGANVDDALDNLQGAISDIDIYPNIGMFGKVAIVGASMSSGWVSVDGGQNMVQNLDFAWGQILGKMWGICPMIYSISGITTKDYLNPNNANYDIFGYGALAADNATSGGRQYNKSGLFIITLGVNDANADPTSANIGSSSDINTSNPDLNSDTFWGNYGKVVQKIQALYAPNRIIISGFKRASIPNLDAAYTNYNAAIKSIAQFFNLPYIDPADHPFFNSAFWLDNFVHAHPTAPLYSGMAKAMSDLISKCMKANLAYFTDTYAGYGVMDTYYYFETYSNVTLENNVIANIHNVTLPRGIYLINISGTFLNMNTGTAELGLALNDTSVQADRFHGVVLTQAQSNRITISLIILVRDSYRTFHFNARQNSGASITLQYPGLVIARVG